MATLVLKAHFDGEHIQLDEPASLPKDVSLTVIVHDPDAELATERAEWYELGKHSLARAYGDDEPEYTIEDARP